MIAKTDRQGEDVKLDRYRGNLPCRDSGRRGRGGLREREQVSPSLPLSPLPRRLVENLPYRTSYFVGVDDSVRRTFLIQRKSIVYELKRPVTSQSLKAVLDEHIK